MPSSSGVSAGVIGAGLATAAGSVPAGRVGATAPEGGVARHQGGYRAGRVARALLTGALVAGALVLGGVACSFPSAAGGSHSVAPSFDARTTALTLRKTDAGGVETVVARETSDASRVSQIRAQVRQEADSFGQGRYADPAKEHGMVMPGSKELEAGYASVQVQYTDLPAGGEITYTATDPALVAALHSWFDRRGLAS